MFQQAFKDIFKKDYTDEMLEDAKEELNAQQKNEGPRDVDDSHSADAAAGEN
jgi:hypothetical protein